MKPSYELMKTSLFIYENKEVSIWKEILQEEKIRNVVGVERAIWAKRHGDIYLYALIRSQQIDFLAEVEFYDSFISDMQECNGKFNILHVIAEHCLDEDKFESLKRYVDHVFARSPLSLIKKNSAGLSPFNLAVAHDNFTFIKHVSSLLFKISEQDKAINSRFMQALFTKDNDDILTWAKRNGATTETLKALHDMGATFYADSSYATFEDDFKKYHPDYNFKDSPFYSPSQFKKIFARNENGEGSSSRFPQHLYKGSVSYWRHLLEGREAQLFRFSSRKKEIGNFLSLAEDLYHVPINFPQHKALVQKIIKALELEKSTLHEKSPNTRVTEKLLPQCLYDFVTIFDLKDGADLNPVTLFCIWIPSYIIVMNYLITDALDSRRLWRDWRAILTAYPGCGNLPYDDKLNCVTSVSKVDNCCISAGFLDECDGWIEGYTKCHDAYMEYKDLNKICASVGVLYYAPGVIIMMYLVPLIVRIIFSIYQALISGLMSIEYLCGQSSQQQYIRNLQSILIDIQCEIDKKIGSILSRHNYPEPSENEISAHITLITGLLKSYEANVQNLPMGEHMNETVLNQVLARIPQAKNLSRNDDAEPTRFTLCFTRNTETDLESQPLLTNEEPRQSKSRWCSII